MRKLIVCNIMTLDGYFTGPDNNVMVMPMGDPGFDLYNAERLRAADTLLLGRVSFDGFRGYWPTVKDDPNADETNKEISRLNGAMPKVVISDTLTDDQTAPWTNTRILKRADAHKEVAALKAQEGKDILVFGSHILWNDLLAAGLVDELHLMIGHAIIGDGVPIFDGQPPTSLTLIDTRTWEGGSNVLVRYKVEYTA